MLNSNLPTVGTLEEILGIAKIGYWLIDHASGEFAASANFPSLIGYPNGSLPAEQSIWLTLAHPDDRATLKHCLAGAQPSLPCNTPVRLQQADGHWAWFEIKVGTTSQQHSILTFRDISQQRQMEAAARDSQLRYHALYRTAPLAFIQWDRRGYISDWNSHAERIFQRSSAQVIGKQVHKLLLPEECHDAFNNTIKDLIHQRGDGLFSGPALGGDGLFLRCNWYNVALRNPAGQLLGILSLILDVTSEHLAKQGLEKSQTTYRTLVETSPDAILLLGLNGSVQMANQQACHLFQLDPLDNYNRTKLADFLPKGVTPLQQLIDSPDEFNGFVASENLEMQSRNGRAFIASTSFTAIADSHGHTTGMVLFVRDVTEKLRSERELDDHRRNLEQLIRDRTHELQGARDSLAQIVDGTPVPAFVIDRAKTITHWNKACEELVGIPAAEVIGTSEHWRAFYDRPRPLMADLLINQQLDELPMLYGGVFRPSTVVHGGYEAEGYFPRIGRWLFFTAAPLYDAQGNITGAIETLQDITDRKHSETALKEAMQKAESAASAKADFLANMSHEIRTPINAVIGLAHLLMKTDLSGKQQDYVARIHGAGQMLLGLINDILDFSKIEAGCMTIESTEFSLDDVLSNVTTIVLDKAQEKGLELHYMVDPELPYQLLGDPLRLSQVLINLVGNAIKFTARGTITVSMRCQSVQDKTLQLEVSVQDTGIGIAKEQQEKLFLAFSQADNSITRKFGGTGLGLTICKRLVELMGGNIRVESEPDVGSTFSFTVQTGIGEQLSGPPIVNRRVLVVDDNPFARRVLIALLEKQGCQVTAVASGEAALTILDSSKGAEFDLVTLDLNMPGMDGLELTQILRERYGRRQRLALVTSTDTGQLEAGHQLDSIDMVLNKPVTAAQISRLLSGEPHRPASRSAPTRAPLAGMRILLVEDIQTNQLIAREMLESLGVTVKTANNGREAVDEMARHGQRYDLILMDIQMPEMDGLEATRRLRAPPFSIQLPIIAMTAHAFAEERQRCLASGMNEFLTKPIDPEQLYSVLDTYRPSFATSAPTVMTSTATAPIDFPKLPGINTDEGLQRMMNKPALYEKVLRDFAKRFRDEASAIRRALATGDLTDAARRAHSAKGLAGSIGAGALQICATELESSLLNQQLAVIDDQVSTFAERLAEVVAGIDRAFPAA